MGAVSPDDVAASIIVDDTLDSATLEFARFLFSQSHTQRDWAEGAITRLAHNWKLERIAVVDRLVLRMAMTELKVMPDVPVKVVLNEAIELVKRYSTADSASFVNGILDSFIKNEAASPQV